MKHKKIIILIVLLIALVGVTTGGVLAWLTDTAKTSEKTFTVGNVSYTWVEGTLKSTPIVPGENLVTSNYTLTNQSTVSSELRVTISIVENIENGLDASNILTVTLGSNWSEVDGKYYYQAGSAVDGKYPILPSTTSITVLTGITLNGNVVGNSYSGKTYKVTLTFEAKQSDFVTWEQLGQVNFETGL